MMSRVARLGTRSAPPLALSATAPRVASQSVRRRRFGRVGRVLPAQRQLFLQIGNLLFGVSQLLVAFGHLTPQIFVLAQQPLIFPTQLFTTGLAGVRMATRPCSRPPRAATRPRTHPPYVKRYPNICPAKCLIHLNCYPWRNAPFT